MVQLLLSSLTTLISSDVKTLGERAKRNAVCYLIMALAGLICVFFLLIALFFALASKLGLINAALLIAAGSAIIGVISYSINRLLERARQKRLQQRRIALDTNAAMTAMAAAAVPTLLKRPLLALAIPAIGIIAVTLLAKDKDKSSGSGRKP